MNVEYTLAHGDYIAYYAFLEAQKGPGWHGAYAGNLIQATFAALFLTCTVGGLLSGLFFGTKALFRFAGDEPGPWPVVAVGVGVLSCVLAIPLAYYFGESNAQKARRRAKRLVDRALATGALNLGYRFQLTVGPDGYRKVASLQETHDRVQLTERREFQVPWEVVQTVEATDRYVIILTTQDWFNVLVPRKSFPDEESFDGFVGEVRARWEGKAVPAGLEDRPDKATAIRSKPLDGG